MSHPAVEAHRQAADALETAAKKHRTAAQAHETDDHIEAKEHSEDAHKAALDAILKSEVAKNASHSSRTQKREDKESEDDKDEDE